MKRQDIKNLISSFKPDGDNSDIVFFPHNFIKNIHFLEKGLIIFVNYITINKVKIKNNFGG